jgi:hypothetical protein
VNKFFVRCLVIIMGVAAICISLPLLHSITLYMSINGFIAPDLLFFPSRDVYNFNMASASPEILNFYIRTLWTWNLFLFFGYGLALTSSIQMMQRKHILVLIPIGAVLMDLCKNIVITFSYVFGGNVFYMFLIFNALKWLLLAASVLILVFLLLRTGIGLIRHVIWMRNS